MLLARACKLQNPAVSTDRLANSWGTCLKHLSRYTKVSGVANNCYSILQEKVKLVSSKLSVPQGLTNHKITDYHLRSPGRETTIAIAGITETPPTGHTGHNTMNPASSESDAFLEFQGFPESANNMLDTAFIDMMNDYTDGIDMTDTLPWPTMPYLAQLETRNFVTLQ